jgi:hypothetical protein
VLGHSFQDEDTGILDSLHHARYTVLLLHRLEGGRENSDGIPVAKTERITGGTGGYLRLDVPHLAVLNERTESGNKRAGV